MIQKEVEEVEDHGMEEEEGEGFRFFQPLSSTLFSLFQVITGGIDWNDASEPLVLISPILGFIFMIYIAFAVLCVQCSL